MSNSNSDDEDINPCPDCNEMGDTCDNCLDGMDRVYWRNYWDGKISEQSSYEDEKEYEDEQEPEISEDSSNEDESDRDESFPLPTYSQPPHIEREVSENEENHIWVSDDEDAPPHIWVSGDEDENEENHIWVSGDEDEDERSSVPLATYPPHVLHHHFHWDMQRLSLSQDRHTKTPKS